MHCKENDIFLLSVGELSKRKNHKVVIEALARLKNEHLKYFICGQGEYESFLQNLIADMGLEKQVVLLGFRTDIKELCNAADIFVFPSLQEGLPMALMESMASGLPAIVSRIRGNTDLIVEKRGGILCAANRPEEFSEAIQSLSVDKQLMESMGRFNKAESLQYDCEGVDRKMHEIYQKI